MGREENAMPMSDDDKKGKWDETKGKMKKAWGEITGDREKKVEGTMDKAKGKLEDVKGDVKRSIDDARNPDKP
jgi:uncharacterized protein YjbJ (UPF0337 family)